MKQHTLQKTIWIIAFFLLNTITLNAFASPEDTITEAKPTPILPEDSIRANFKIYIPQNHDVDMLEDRLACIESEIPLTYNDVLMGFIKLYTVRRREYTQEILSRKTFYFPIFEQTLRKYNMPEEIKYLSVVESALKPRIESPAAAMGLWQFIPSTGRYYGLHQDEYIDERMDIYKSTEAACLYLKDLYAMFGDWHLAMAAYNCGPGRVRYALNASGGGDFWSVYAYLPRETRAYVPMYIAVAYALNYAEEHNIYVDKTETPIPAESITVNQFVSIESFGDAIGVPLEVMIKLNPHLKKNFIPDYMRNYKIWFPADKATLVKAKKEKILVAAEKLPLRQPKFDIGDDNWKMSTEGKLLRIHLVEENQSLESISQIYEVAIANLKVWNQLTEDELKVGQEILIWQSPKNYSGTY